MSGPKDSSNDPANVVDPFATALDEALAAATVVVERRAGPADDDLWLSSPSSSDESEHVGNVLLPDLESDVQPQLGEDLDLVPPAGFGSKALIGDANPAPSNSKMESIIVAPTAVSDGLFESASSARPTLKTPQVPFEDKEKRPVAPVVKLDVSPAAQPLAAAGEAQDNNTEADEKSAEKAEKAETTEQAFVQALASFGRLLRAAVAPKVEQAVLLSAAKQCQSTFALCPPLFDLVLQGGVWLCDQRWLHIPASEAADVQFVTAALTRTKRGGIAMTTHPQSQQLLSAAQDIVSGLRGHVVQWPNGTLSLLPAEPNAINGERWAHGVAEFVTNVAERSQGSSRLLSDEAADALDMVEQILNVQPGAMMRAIELRSGSWTNSWSTLASVAWVSMAGLRAQVNPRTRRAIALTQWCLSTAARRGEQPSKLSEAATQALLRISMENDFRSPLLAACTGWLQGFSTMQPDHGPMGLIRLVHEAHRARVAGARSPLTALAAARHKDDESWLPLLLAAIGPLPIGTAVNTGRVAVVVDLAPPDAPLRPAIQIGKQLVRPGTDLSPVQAGRGF